MNLRFLRRWNERGAELVEVMVALAIFVTVAVGFTGSTDHARRTSDTSRHTTEATTLAFDKLEQIASLSATDPQLSVGSHADASNPLTAGGTQGGIFTRTWTVVSSFPPFSPAISPGSVGRVDVRVSWRERGATPSVTIVTYTFLGN